MLQCCSMLCVVLVLPWTPEARSRELVGSFTMHSFSKLSSLCKLIAPIWLPSLSTSKASRFLSINDEKPYHCSAAYAATLHSISLPFRMEPLGPTADSSYASGAVTVSEVVQILSEKARQNMVAILDAAMPSPSLTGNRVGQNLTGNLRPLTPEVAEDVEDLQSVESMIVHGALGSGGYRASISEVRTQSMLPMSMQ